METKVSMNTEDNHFDNSEAISSDEENEKLIDGKIQKLLLDIETTPFQYDKHIELISALRASSDLDRLRTAREKMARIYPLTEELWLEWFKDELPLAEIPEQKQYIISKFELAVNDYASVKVWHEYCQYMMNNIDTASDIDRARKVFELALTAVGLHVTEGSFIWDGYREFELAILDSYQQLEESGDAVGMESKVEAQIERIASLYKRELSIPLLSLEKTYQSFQDWYCEPISGETKRLYERASQKLTLLMEYEEKLYEAKGNKLAEYHVYVDYELKGGDPARIQSIFERAIKDNCLNYELWEKYTDFMDFKLKIPSLAVQIHKRATRNCPWVSKLWQNYLKALERNTVESEVYLDVFNQSLKGGFSGREPYLQLLVTKCDYYRRRITDWDTERQKIDELRKSFESGVAYMDHYFGLLGDINCVLLREWAFIEAKYLDDVKRAQELWDMVMKKHSRDSAMWIEYLNFLQLFTDMLTVRKAFQRAVQVNMDKPEVICEEFMKYERRHGRLSDIDDAQQKINIQIRKTKERHERESINDDDDDDEVPNNRRKMKYKFGKHKDHGKQRKKIGKESDSSKRAIETSPHSQPKNKKQFFDHESKKLTLNKDPDFPDQSRNVCESNNDGICNVPDNKLAPDEAPSSISIQSQPGNNSSLVNVVKDSIEMSCEDEKSDTKADETNKLEIASSKVDNDISVFLSNLSYTAGESDIREMFKECGDIDQVHIVLNKDGKSKGYAYLQFKEKESVAEALKLDRQPLLNRPLYVSKCTDKKENPTQFPFSTSLNKHTLYVTNLPFEATSDEVTTHFSQVGALKEVRLVTNRSGKSKGFAYVEYESETVAASALLTLDKKVFMGRPINVHLSKPPARKQNHPSKPNKQDTFMSKQKTQEVPGSRGKAKTQISLVPRALQQKAAIATKSSVDTKSTELDAVETVATTETTPVAMSNSDFRKFLLK